MARARPPTIPPAMPPRPDASLLDLVDNLLNQGVLLTGEIHLSLANVDLVTARLSLLLCASDLLLPLHKPRTRALRNARKHPALRLVRG